MLPNLTTLILVGKKAQQARPELEEVTDLKIFETMHPSKKVMMRWPQNRRILLTTLREIKGNKKVELRS